jgi:ORF6N domain
MKQLKPLESMILTLRERKVIIDADLAALYAVPTKALNQAVRRNEDRFPRDFVFQLTAKERLEVVTNCDHLAQLKFSRTLPMAFTEHGAIMAATVLNSPQAVSMSVFV